MSIFILSPVTQSLLDKMTPKNKFVYEEGRRLGLESELNYMGRDLINLAYIMKPLSKAQLSVPGRQYSVCGHLHRAGRGIGHLVSEIYRLSCRTS